MNITKCRHETDSDTESEPENYDTCQPKRSKYLQKKNPEILPKINGKLKGTKSSRQGNVDEGIRCIKPPRKQVNTYNVLL